MEPLRIGQDGQGVHTVRELYDLLTGRGGEHWVLSTSARYGSASLAPLFGYEGDLIVGFTPELYGRVSGDDTTDQKALLPEDAELVGHGHDEFEALVALLAADPGGRVMVWDPVLHEAVQAEVVAAGHTIRFIVPTEVLERMREGSPA